MRLVSRFRSSSGRMAQLSGRIASCGCCSNSPLLAFPYHVVGLIAADSGSDDSDSGRLNELAGNYGYCHLLPPRSKATASVACR